MNGVVFAAASGLSCCEDEGVRPYDVISLFGGSCVVEVVK